MKKYALHLLLILVLITSCDNDFEEINRNPNQPEEVNPELLLPNIIRSPVSEMVSSGFSPGNIVVQYSAEIRNPNVDRYQWGSFSGIWNTMYNTLRDINNLGIIADERELPQYKGISLVMKSWVFSILTDAYGDIPYFNALRGKSDGIYEPEYDPQQQIYQGLLADLEEANTLLANVDRTVNGDILYNGDISKWRKLANSLRLRILTRQSNKIDPSAAMQEIVNNPSQFPVFESNDDQAVLTYLDQFPNLFPIANTRSGSWLDRRLSQTFADALNQIGDPRLMVYAQPTEESQALAEAGEGPLQWAGVRNGEADENLGSDIDSRVSQLGSIYYVEQSIAVPAEGLIMTYAELQLILAEAAEKNWISGDPAQYYENAIRASMEYYDGLNADVEIEVTDAYLTQPEVEYSGSQDERLRKIATQKWIALYFNGLQGWFEWRRTGIPGLTPSFVNANNDLIPVRFQYPVEQQALNADSYEAAVQRQGRDDINTRVWWDRP